MTGETAVEETKSNYTEFTAYLIRNGRAVPDKTYRIYNGGAQQLAQVATTPLSLFPFVTTITSNLRLSTQSYPAEQLSDANAILVGADGGKINQEVYNRVSVTQKNIKTTFYELRNINNQVMFVTDIAGIESLFGSETPLTDIKI